LANHKSAIKRTKQNEKRRLRNKTVRTRVRSASKDLRAAAINGSSEDIAQQLNGVKSIIDAAAKKGVIHQNTAARKISRLSKLVDNANA